LVSLPFSPFILVILITQCLWSWIRDRVTDCLWSRALLLLTNRSMV